jgi:ABC-type sugar transport system substrate-binding protein
MMRAAALLTVTAGLSACVAPAEKAAPVWNGPLSVTNNGAPFGNDQGAAAKKVAQAICATRGQTLRTSIYDRFDTGAWVFVEGCV